MSTMKNMNGQANGRLSNQESFKDAVSNMPLTPSSLSRCNEISGIIAKEFEDKISINAVINAMLLISKFDETLVAECIADNASKRPSTGNNLRPFVVMLDPQSNDKLRQLSARVRSHFRRAFSPTLEAILNAVIQITPIDTHSVCAFLRNVYQLKTDKSPKPSNGKKGNSIVVGETKNSISDIEIKPEHQESESLVTVN